MNKSPLESLIEKETDTDVLDTIRKELTEREYAILDYRFGFTSRHSRTLRDIGKQLGVTAERIRSIEAKALRKLRHFQMAKKLEPVLELWQEKHKEAS